MEDLLPQEYGWYHPMAHGLYHSRPIYHYTEEQERAYWQDCITHVQAMTGKRLTGRLGGDAGYTVRTDDLMAEAGCLYHTSDFVTVLFYEVDEQIRAIPQHPEVHLWPSEVVTLGLLHALKGVGNRAFLHRTLL